MADTEKRLHAHMQIQYDGEDGGGVESLVGFSPTDAEDRQLAHDMLDEFLDHHVKPHFIAGTEGSNDCWFKVFGELDTH